jgi:hypothetical protein
MVRLPNGVLAAGLAGFLALPCCEATQPKQVEAPNEDATDMDDPGPPSESVAGQPMAADPSFSGDMSVDDAIKAVPAASDRLNIEQEVLAEPLQQEDLYEPCKLGEGHFKARVAVWNGRAVGVDVETQPSNPHLAKCIDQQIRGVKWTDKVRSLNTVEYSY